ncbi:XRE family transcriptional regulator [Campylobacter concisus]|uniref:XRE family transcriptional regulator n=1 Tax=Campylobacter concisus TaxID=199 RepID=UPI000CD9921B|nr:LexA family transcriptional regulator [Campylobacter concisus]
MDLAQKIKFLRSENGWTQEDLANKSGVSIQSIKRYETNMGGNITTSNLEKIAKAFNVQTSYFLKDNNSSLEVRKSDENLVRKSFVSPENLSISPTNLKNSQKDIKTISIPYFEDTYASAGGGMINYDEAPVIMDFDENFLRMFLRISGSIKGIHIINARGDSMEPTITNGELLFINPMQNENGIISGCIYIINYDGDLYVKRIEKNPTTKAITLFSDNKKYEPIVIQKQDLECCHIMGRVVSHMKKS